MKIYKIQNYKLHTWLWLSQSRRFLKSVCLKMAIVLSCRIWTGRESQSFAPAYTNIVCPILVLTFGKSNNVSSRSSRLLTLRRNLKIPNSCSGQSKLFKILKISANLKNHLLLSKVKSFSSLRISWVHVFLPTFSIILIARFCTTSTPSLETLDHAFRLPAVHQPFIFWFVSFFLLSFPSFMTGYFLFNIS